MGSAAGADAGSLRNVVTAGLRWRLVDAHGETVGRLAARLAHVLQGKDKPTFCPWRDDGDVVVVVNAKDVRLTGNKWDDKVYYRHSGYPGGLKQRTARELHERDGTAVLYKAVERMLPKNRLRPGRLRKLRIFEGPEHGFAAAPLVPWEMPRRAAGGDRGPVELPEGWVPLNPAVALGGREAVEVPEEEFFAKLEAGRKKKGKGRRAVTEAESESGS